MSIHYSKNDLKQLYIKKISHRLNFMEKKRKKLIFSSLLSFISLGYIFFCFIIFALAPKNFKSNIENYTYISVDFIIFLIIISIIVLIHTHKEKKRFKKIFKEKIIRSILKVIYPSATYHHNQGISQDDYNQSQLFKSSYNIYRSEDMIKMKYRDQMIKFSEVLSQYKGRGKNQTTKTIFRGFILKAQLPFQSRHQTIIIPDISESFFGKAIGRFFQKNNIYRKEKLIQLEDVRFEKMYVVYGGDQIEARKLLTPKIMEKILRYNDKTRKKISLSFINNHVYIAIATHHNYFEPTIWRKIKFSDIIKLTEMLEVITEVLDILEIQKKQAS